MGLHAAFTALAEVVAEYESRGRTVSSVEATPRDTGEAVIDASLVMPLSVSAAESDQGCAPKSARVTDDGTVQVEFELTDDVPAPAGVTVSDRSVSVTEDGLTLTLTLVIDAGAAVASGEEAVADPRERVRDRSSVTASEPTDSESGDGSESDEPAPAADDRFADVRDDAVPPYEDVPYLQALYDECDNFAEIAEEIQMDVSSETVRRYMIEADIHAPNTYNTTASDGEDSTASADSDDADEVTAVDEDPQANSTRPQSTESTDAPGHDGGDLPDEQLITDGIGLPDGVRLQDVADAVVDSETVYEVQRGLGLGRTQTRELLDDLNLLDLLLRRVADSSGQTASYDVVASRINQCAP